MTSPLRRICLAMVRYAAEWDAMQAVAQRATAHDNRITLLAWDVNADLDGNPTVYPHDVCSLAIVDDDRLFPKDHPWPIS